MNTETQAPRSTAVVIGRFQLPHLGHSTLFNAALGIADRVVIVLGSSYRSRNVTNPFNWEERREMILAAIAPQDRSRVTFLPVRDFYDDDRWNAAVREGVASLVTLGEKVTLIGFKKDHSSYYLDHFREWVRLEVERSYDIDATSLRNVFFESDDIDGALSVLRPLVAPGVLNYLQAWALLPVFEERQKEHRAVADYRKRWTANAYLTADALVQASVDSTPYVLLVRRGPGTIGEGQWALPGGFVDKGERIYSAAVRELGEETGFKPLASTLKNALQSSEVFDHPARSARGRLVTQAFFFNMGNMRSLPEVEGADDVAHAEWIPVSQLPSLEHLFFEDHAAILERFVGLY